MAARMNKKLFSEFVLDLIKTRNYSLNCKAIPYETFRIPRTQKSGFNQASSSFTSTAVAKETPTSHEIPQIQVAVCLQRLPIITREKIELEKHYTELQEQLEFEHSSLSDYEINKINMKNLREKLKHDEDNDELKKEIAMSESEYQELQEIEQEHLKNAMLGSRKTDADKAGSKHSPNRQLDEPLFLITQNKEDNTKWQFPQGPVEPEETLRQAAERIISNHVSNNFGVQFLSNAPSGIYRRPEKDGLARDTAKVFFYQGNLQGAIHKYSDDMWFQSLWASKDELKNYLPKNYFQCVSKFLF